MPKRFRYRNAQSAKQFTTITLTRLCFSSAATLSVSIVSLASSSLPHLVNHHKNPHLPVLNAATSPLSATPSSSSLKTSLSSLPSFPPPPPPTQTPTPPTTRAMPILVDFIVLQQAAPDGLGICVEIMN